MSENAGVSAPTTGSTEGGEQSQAQGSQTGSSEEVPNPNMSGAEAVEWVKAQKAKKEAAQAKPKEEVSAEQAAQDKIEEIKKKFKVKIDGQESEVDEDELVKGYQLQKASAKRMQEAQRLAQENKKLQEQNKKFVELMKNPQNVPQVLKQLGYNDQTIRQMTEEYLYSQLQEDEMDPRDKELRIYKAQVEAIKQKEAQEKEAKAQQVREEMKARYAEDYQKQFIGALEKTGLPKTGQMVSRMAQMIHRAAEAKFELSVDEAAMLVRQDLEAEYRALYGQAEPDTLVKLLGDEQVKKIRNYGNSKVIDPYANHKTPADQGSPREKKTQENRTHSSWREYNRK